MRQHFKFAADISMAISVLLVTCGAGTSYGAVASTHRSTSKLLGSVQRKLLSAKDFGTQLRSTEEGQAILRVAGQPKCDVSVNHIEYATTGGAGEATTASGVLMVPTGTDASCQGKRPIVLYAHGTALSKAFNLASTDASNEAHYETTLIGATFAAQGYIVIAPNYAGYDTSKLTYHPYINDKQQSQEMIDALQAGRSALQKRDQNTSTDSGKLFVTGYSEGGYVAMATLKAMDAAHISVTAGAPMSGPYAIAAYADEIFRGNVSMGSTVHIPLLVTSYQNAYGDIYKTTSEIFNPEYAKDIDHLVPATLSMDQLVAAGRLPQAALFKSVSDAKGDPSDALTNKSLANSPFRFGYDSKHFLINNHFRYVYLKDQRAHPDGRSESAKGNSVLAASARSPLRQALARNDLRHFIPSMPTLMCGGHNDPIVFFSSNTELMAGLLKRATAQGAHVSFAVLDVDASVKNSAGFIQIGVKDTSKDSMQALAQQAQAAFKNAQQKTGETAALATVSGKAAGQLADAQLSAQVGRSSKPQIAAGAAAVATPDGAAAAKTAIAASYHPTLVSLSCTGAARAFFEQY